jgi:hypothetical protein
MSKQCRPFLLPPDTERLLEEVRSRGGLKIISRRSSSLNPIELKSPFSEYVSRVTSQRHVYVDCCLTCPGSAQIHMQYLETQRQWTVLESSEVMEFSGCDLCRQGCGGMGACWRTISGTVIKDFSASKIALPANPDSYKDAPSGIVCVAHKVPQIALSPPATKSIQSYGRLSPLLHSGSE